MNNQIQNQIQTMPQYLRNDGIDLLRILSMLYIVVLHCLGLGGALEAVPMESSTYFVGWMMQMWVYCAVNIFALISGYVGYCDKERKFQYANYILLWLQVVFWNALLTVVCSLVAGQGVSLLAIVRSCLPVTTNTHWYFTAYTGLFFLIPVLNTAVRSSSHRCLRWLFAVMFVLFSLYSTVADRWRLEEGFSLLWLMVLYLMGAIMKKCGFGAGLSQKKAFAGIVICTLLSWLWVLYENRAGYLFSGSLVCEIYLTPTYLISAMLHVLLFSRLQVPNSIKKWIRFAAPGAFAVYLINCHNSVLDAYVRFRFQWLGALPVLEFVSWTLLISVVFVAACLCADFLRQKLFGILRVKALAQKVMDMVMLATDCVMKKLFPVQGENM